MTTAYTIHSPHLLHLEGEGGSLFYSGNQEWYKRFWQRLSGCGPTNASNLMHYLSRTRESCAKLSPYDSQTRKGFLQLMEACWQYVTPGKGGVNTTKKFLDGVVDYGEDRGIILQRHVLNVPEEKSRRPEAGAVMQFIRNAFDKDLPVAFLNLDNGAVQELDKWHWVTLVECDVKDNTVVVYDQGKRFRMSIGLWLETTEAGGGFAAVEPVEK